MLEFQTKRLVARTNLLLLNGCLLRNDNLPQDSLNIFKTDEEEKSYQLQVQMLSSFVFFDKMQPENPMCYIAYCDNNRNHYELHWETLPPYRKQGYMTEALMGFISWMTENTNDKNLWALIQDTNLPSIKTANKCGFVKTEEKWTGTPWYKFQIVQNT